MRKNGEKNYLFRWIAVILLIMELIASGNFLDMKKSSFINGLQYEISPLKIKSVVITDRADLREYYARDYDDRLFEVVVTYENIGVYAGETNMMPDLSAKDREYHASRAMPKKDLRLNYAESDTQIIPAGKTGSVRYFYAIDPGADWVEISDGIASLYNLKLKDRESIKIRLPETEGEQTFWERTE